jgi:hypothetical protein
VALPKEVSTTNNLTSFVANVRSQDKSLFEGANDIIALVNQTSGNGADTNETKRNVSIIHSDVLSVEIQRLNGERVNVQNLTDPVQLNLSISDYNSSKVYRCSWFDNTNLSWRTDGCNTSRYDAENKKFICNCSHLTDFAIVTQEADSAPTQVQAESSITATNDNNKNTTTNDNKNNNAGNNQGGVTKSATIFNALFTLVAAFALRQLF